METTSQWIRKDSLFLVTLGEYDDYRVWGVYKANMDIDITALHSEYMTLYPEEGEEHRFNSEQFLEWLEYTKEACRELEYVEFYLGSYSTASFEIRDPRSD